MNRTAPRRALVLTTESARHPFRASLPAGSLTSEAQRPHTWRLSRRDWRDLLGTYVASFLAITIFIA
jgi:hypothetical protein